MASCTSRASWDASTLPDGLPLLPDLLGCFYTAGWPRAPRGPRGMLLHCRMASCPSRYAWDASIGEDGHRGKSSRARLWVLRGEAKNSAYAPFSSPQTLRTPHFLPPESLRTHIR